MSGASRGERTRQFVRATKHFARTVFSELKRAGYAREDILRFVNELMTLLADEARAEASGSHPPGIFDAEAGVLDRDTIQEILDFQLMRAARDRRRSPVTVLGIDVVVPSWVATAVKTEVHEVLATSLKDRLRATDSLGKLGPERYLLVLPEAKPGVHAALRERLRCVVAESERLPEGLELRLRSARDEGEAGVASLLDECFARPADTIAVRPDEVGLAEASADGGPALTRRRRDRVVLCLGGGAARAASHAGVLTGLGNKSIEVAGIAGSSGGALVGAMRARGMGPDEIVRRFEGFAETPIYRAMRRAYASYLREARRRGSRLSAAPFGEGSFSFYSETKLAAISQELLDAFVDYFIGDDVDMATLEIPLAIAATDLVEGRAVVLSHGSLHAAVAASVAIPGLFPLQSRGERLLADGSAVGDVPISAAHLLGLHAPVFAVHLQSPASFVPEYRSSAELLSRIGGLVHRELVREQLRRAGFLISVPSEEIGWLDFRRAKQAAELGMRAAVERVEVAGRDEADTQARGEGT